MELNLPSSYAGAMALRTSNPALSASTFLNTSAEAGAAQMSVQGTANKTLVLLFFALLTGVWSWGEVMRGHPSVFGWLLGCTIGALVCAIITVFKKTWAPLTAPAYAAFEGVALGGYSAVLEAQYPGIVVQAVALTFGTLFTLLVLYSTRVIKVTEKFRMGVFAATGAIFLLYLVSFVLSFFNIHMGFIHDSGLIGIGFSVFVVAVAALNLVLDFDFIEAGAARGAPKYMEWYGAFGLMVTLVWLYVEILRLLAKTRRRD